MKKILIALKSILTSYNILGLITLLICLFIIKVTGAVDLPWLIVLLPLWYPFAIFFIGVVMMEIIKLFRLIVAIVMSIWK